jgi:hypothetical protein
LRRTRHGSLIVLHAFGFEDRELGGGSPEAVCVRRNRAREKLLAAVGI